MMCAPLRAAEKPAGRRPHVDDRALWDLFAGLLGLPAVLVARELQLFALLAKQRISPRRPLSLSSRRSTGSRDGGPAAASGEARIKMP
jgi:hypothetical protein